MRRVAKLGGSVFRGGREGLRFVRAVGSGFVTIRAVEIGAMKIVVPRVVMRLLVVIVIRIILVWMIVILHLVLVSDVIVGRRRAVRLTELRRIRRRVLMVRILDDGALHAFAVIAPA